MGEINLCNSKGRDAVVQSMGVGVPVRVRWVDAEGRQAQVVNILKSTVDLGTEALMEKAGTLANVADLLVQGDPEIDFETVGSFLRELTRVYIDVDRKIVHRVQHVEVLKNPDGTERERRPRKMHIPNVGGDVPPLRWSGKTMKKSELYHRFVFSQKMQITHVNGLTYDFLYGMAKELEDSQSLLLVGAGNKANLPLLVRRGGTPYRGFLEGRTQGEKYALVLHLSNLELKAPEPGPEKPPEVPVS